MSSPNTQILGAYKLAATPDLFAQAMESKYGGLALSNNERRLAEEHVRNELASVVLIEALISGRDERFSVGDFGQTGSDQAPYSEVFLSADGRAVIAEAYDVPADSTLRIAFYLHYAEPDRELNTSYGPVKLPPLQSIPKRLAELMPYEPVT